MSQSYDIAIIGGGPGGYVAAIRAAQLGLNPVVIERAHLGGICLNWGCIPTKALLKSAELYTQIKHAGEFGINVEGTSIDFEKIIQRSRDVSARLTGGIGYLMKKNKITVVEGEASFLDKNTLSVKGEEGDSEISASNIIIAAGARARHLPGLEPDGKFIWSYREALKPDTFPESLCVIGSGAIGAEFASFFNALGSKVTMIEIAERITPAEDEEISTLAEKAFKKAGMDIRTRTTVTDKTVKDGKIHLTIETEANETGAKSEKKSETKAFDRVIVAVGIAPNSEALKLEKVSIVQNKGFIKTDGFGRTNVAGIYAIGDITNPPWLAHKASHEGVIAVETIAGNNPHPLNTARIPGCTYTSPQIASVGLTETEARNKGYELNVGKFPFQANGKALALGEPEGMIKTIFDKKTGELLGAHMIGAEVTELIQGYVLAMGLESTEQELMETIFPHPTLSEMMHEAVLDAFGQTIHI